MFRVFIRKMSEIAIKLQNNAELAEKRLAELKHKMQEIKKIKLEEKIVELEHENEYLVRKIAIAKDELIKLEVSHGKKQYVIPSKPSSENNIMIKQDVKVESIPNVEKIEKKSVKNVKEKKPVQPIVDNSLIDVRKLDLRIGRIVDINKHPDADTLYVEKIDCGEEAPRTVVSGLVNHVSIEEMKERIVMVLCNLKPVKMRGVTSEAMVMCASTPTKVEVLIPPKGSIPGDLVICEGYPREPEPQLNPKKKIFETCAPDLNTNNDRIACYKGSPLVVPGKGPITAATLQGASVK